MFHLSIAFLEEIRMESPKDATKKAKLHSKLNLEVKTQAIYFKTQELGISLLPRCRKKGQNTQ